MISDRDWCEESHRERLSLLLHAVATQAANKLGQLSPLPFFLSVL